MTEETKVPPAQALTDEERKERERARRRAWKLAHPEKVREYRERYREKYPEKKRAHDKKYRETHREKLLAYREAHRERERARRRFHHDRTRYAHIEGYMPTSDRKQWNHIRPVSSLGFLYLAHDRNTGALKIGGCQRALETRLENYRAKEGDGVTFLRVSGVLPDALARETEAHDRLRGNVRPVRTDDKTRDAVSPRAEWFQLAGGFTFSDVLEVFNAVTREA